MAAPKVLMVDDEKDMEFLARQKFRKAISDEKFQLVFAQNGREALSLIESDTEIVIVISDIKMPEMDGLSLLKHIQENYPHICTILVSAYGDLNTLRQAMNYGAFDFVTKPVDFKDLEDSVSRGLEKVARLTSKMGRLTSL